MIDIKLMPCPMCGGKVKPPTMHLASGGMDGYNPRISCNCGLQYEGMCTAESLVRCWNRRPKEIIPDVSADMLRAAQLRSELGAYVTSKLSGAYGLIREMYKVMREAETEIEWLDTQI